MLRAGLATLGAAAAWGHDGDQTYSGGMTQLVVSEGRDENTRTVVVLVTLPEQR